MDIYLDIFGHPLISQRDIYASCRYPKRISSCLQISRYISSPMLISKADIFLSSDIHGYLVAFLSPFGYQAGYPGPLSVAIHEISYHYIYTLPRISIHSAALGPPGTAPWPASMRLLLSKRVFTHTLPYGTDSRPAVRHATHIEHSWRCSAPAPSVDSGSSFTGVVIGQSLTHRQG